jgi:hypothetical protein
MMGWRKVYDQEEKTEATKTLAAKAGPARAETPSCAAAQSD